jgi:hypothetical protein
MDPSKQYARHRKDCYFFIGGRLGCCQNPSLYKTGMSVRVRAERDSYPLDLPSVFRYFPPAVAKTYVVTFRSHNDDRPSKFIVVADNMKSAINVAWEHGGADFQSRFDKSTAQAQEMKKGALRVL